VYSSFFLSGSLFFKIGTSGCKKTRRVAMTKAPGLLDLPAQSD
jgi:hypothetical protein